MANSPLRTHANLWWQAWVCAAPQRDHPQRRRDVGWLWGCHQENHRSVEGLNCFLCFENKLLPAVFSVFCEFSLGGKYTRRRDNPVWRRCGFYHTQSCRIATGFNIIQSVICWKLHCADFTLWEKNFHKNPKKANSIKLLLPQLLVSSCGGQWSMDRLNQQQCSHQPTACVGH